MPFQSILSETCISGPILYFTFKKTDLYSASNWHQVPHKQRKNSDFEYFVSHKFKDFLVPLNQFSEKDIKIIQNYKLESIYNMSIQVVDDYDSP